MQRSLTCDVGVGHMFLFTSASQHRLLVLKHPFKVYIFLLETKETLWGVLGF